ncbi:alanine racemase [Actinoplanes sp. NPDC049316]|uniref:alanine racemase n=1 Tax=Actinoplanes sp. NPDC049316 TaxID=3154727 RepID=UPI0034406C1A
MHTPAIIVDLQKAKRNIRRLQDSVSSAGRKLRVHVKGHRTTALATLQIEAGASGIMAQTTPEAEQYLRTGIADIVLSRPVLNPWRLHPIVQFIAQHAGRTNTVADPAGTKPPARIVVTVSSAESVRGLGALATDAGVVVPVRIDVKFDDDRGIAPERAGELARLIERTPGVSLEGVSGYRSYASLSALREAARPAGSVAEVLTELAARVRVDGIECPTVSVSGTANAAAGLEVAGVTEICVGAGPLYDAGYALAGLCTLDDVAVTLRATVLESAGRAVRTDADELLDGAAQEWDPGTVAVLADGTPLADAVLIPGTVVELLPAHICPLAMVDVPRTVSDGGRLVGRWHPVLLPEKTNHTEISSDLEKDPE